MPKHPAAYFEIFESRIVPDVKFVPGLRPKAE